MVETKIEWAATANPDGTLRPGRSDWNPVRGCTRKSPGCGGPGPHGGCYAEGIAARFSAPGMAFHGFAEMVDHKPRWTGKVAVMWDRLTDPLKWREPATIFALSMSDLFHEALLDEEIDQVFAVMALGSRHRFQILTKRAARMKSYCADPKTPQRIAALVYDARHEQRTGHSLLCGVWGDGDRRLGPDLADQKAPRETPPKRRERLSKGSRIDILPEGARGIPPPTGIFDDNNDGIRHKNGSHGASGCLDALQQIADPDRHNDQPQERNQRRQQVTESGTYDHVGTASPCDRSPERQQVETKRQQTPKNTPSGGGCIGDSEIAGNRRDGEGYCRTIRDEEQSDFGDMCAENVDAYLTWPLPNVWLGVSVENQKYADERVPDLLATPAAIRFLSCEPLLAGICFNQAWLRRPGGIDLAIIGGESGPKSRPVWVPAIRDMVANLRRADVACFVKQLGANVQDRNDAGFDGCEPDSWPDMDPFDIEHDLGGISTEYQGAPVRVHLKSKKGNDMAEWPEDLRVREMPR